MEMTSLWSSMYLLIIAYSLLVYFLTVYSYDAILYFFVFVFSAALFVVSLGLLLLYPHTLFHIFILIFVFVYSLSIIIFMLLDENKLRLFAESIIRWVSIPIAAIFALLLGMSISQFPIAL